MLMSRLLGNLVACETDTSKVSRRKLRFCPRPRETHCHSPKLNGEIGRSCVAEISVVTLFIEARRKGSQVVGSWCSVRRCQTAGGK